MHTRCPRCDNDLSTKPATAREETLRCSAGVGELEAALRLTKELESASRAHGMWGYEDDWNALTTILSQRLDSDRGRSPSEKLTD